MAADRYSSLRQALTVLGIGVALIAQQLAHARPNEFPAWLLFAIAVGLVGGVISPHSPAADQHAALAPRFGSGWLRVACMIGTLLTVATTTALAVADSWHLLAIILWLLGWILAIAATHGWQVTPPQRTTEPWSVSEVLALFAILCVALAARVPWLDAVPPYFFDDEARVGTFVHDAFNGHIPNFFRMGWNTWPAIGMSVQGAFGLVLPLDTITLRLSSVAMGTLAVLTTYLLARELFSSRAALFAALLLAVSRTAIDFSRLGTCHAQVMFLATFAFFFWWRAVNSGRALDYLWSGIGLGLCLFTYNAGQLLPVLWLGWIALCAIFRPRTIHSHWRGAAITLAGIVIVTFPYVFYFTDHFTFGENWGQWTVMARSRQVTDVLREAWQTNGSGAAIAQLGRQVWLTWLGFSVIPAGAYGLGYRGSGMLDHVTAPLFILGFAVVAAQRGNPRHLFVVYWWLLTAISGSVLTFDPPAFVRLVGIVPVLALLAALPLDWLVATGYTRTRTVAVGMIAAALLAGAAWDNWRTYFVDFPNQSIDEDSRVVRYLRGVPTISTAYFMGSEYYMHFNRELFHLNFAGRRYLDHPEPGALFPLHEAIEMPLILILGPSQTTLVRYIRSLYPEATVRDFRSDEQRLLFRALALDRSDIAQRAGLRHSVTGSDQAPIADPFAAVAASSAGTEVHWTGSVYWPTDHAVTLVIESTKPITVNLADTVTKVSAGEPVRVPLQLPRGWHALALTEQGAEQRTLAMAITDGSATRPLTRWDLRPDDVQEGLTAVYARDGQPLLRAIDPQLNAFAIEELFRPPNDIELHMPFAASWEGRLRVAVAGTYEFEAHGSGPFSVHLDDVMFFDERGMKPEPPRVARVSCTLAAGEYAFRAHWDANHPPPGSTRRVFQLYWTPPGSERELIPPPAFSPVAPRAADRVKPISPQCGPVADSDPPI